MLFLSVIEHGYIMQVSRYYINSISDSSSDIGRRGRGGRNPVRLSRVDDNVVLLLEAAVRLRPPRLVALFAHLATPLALGLSVAAVVPVLAPAHLRTDKNLWEASNHILSWSRL